MLGLFRRSTKKTTQTHNASRLARPRLEALEARDNPSTLSLAVSYEAGRQVTLYGTLSNISNPSMQQITITGQASGMAMTNMQGQFSVSIQASGLGTVSATAADNSSNTPTVTLVDVTPSLTFTATEGSGHLWMLSGDVTYSRGSSGLIVYFGGAPVSLQMDTCSVQNNLHYEISVLLNGTSSDNGNASAKVVTAWGTTSAFAYDNIFQTGT